MVAVGSFSLVNAAEFLCWFCVGISGCLGCLPVWAL